MHRCGHTACTRRRPACPCARPAFRSCISSSAITAPSTTRSRAVCIAWRPALRAGTRSGAAIFPRARIPPTGSRTAACGARSPTSSTTNAPRSRRRWSHSPRSRRSASAARTDAARSGVPSARAAPMLRPRRRDRPMTQRTAAPAMGAAEWAMLIALSVLWGGSFFFNGVAVRELPSLTIVWLRVAIGFAGLLVILRASGERMPTEPRTLVALLGLGLFNNVIPFTLIVWGQHRIPSGLAAILNATTPLFGALAAHLLTRDEKLTPLKITGIAIGFAGVALLVGVDALSGLGTGVAGEAACIAAAIAYALAAIYARRFRRMGVTPLATATGQVGASTFLLLPLVLIVDQPWTLPMPHAATWAAMLGAGLLATSVAFILYFRIIASSGATNALLVTFLVPLSAILLGALLLHEALLPRHFAGMALIGLGLAFIDGRLPRRLLQRDWRARSVA